MSSKLSNAAENDVSALQLIIETVAEYTGRPQDALPPLGYTLDIDAVERLISDESPVKTIQFDYHGHSITLENHDELTCTIQQIPPSENNEWL